MFSLYMQWRRKAVLKIVKESNRKYKITVLSFESKLDVLLNFSWHMVQTVPVFVVALFKTTKPTANTPGGASTLSGHSTEIVVKHTNL
jgi:hypothetical protein